MHCVAQQWCGCFSLERMVSYHLRQATVSQNKPNHTGGSKPNILNMETVSKYRTDHIQVSRWPITWPCCLAYHDHDVVAAACIVACATTTMSALKAPVVDLHRHSLSLAHTHTLSLSSNLSLSRLLIILSAFSLVHFHSACLLCPPSYHVPIIGHY